LRQRRRIPISRASGRWSPPPSASYFCPSPHECSRFEFVPDLNPLLPRFQSQFKIDSFPILSHGPIISALSFWWSEFWTTWLAGDMDLVKRHAPHRRAHFEILPAPGKVDARSYSSSYPFPLHSCVNQVCSQLFLCSCRK
jgi:hypothetical protein